MNKNTIVVYQDSKVPCFRVQERHICRLREALPETNVLWCRTQDEYLGALPQADVVISGKFKQEWFAKAPRLRLIGTPAAGRDFFSVTSIPDHIEIKNGTFHGPVMAETILGVMLAFNRGVLAAYSRQLRGELWPVQTLFGNRLISGTHAVIVGFGRIGQYTGRMLKPFNVRVTGIRRSDPGELPDWFEEGDTVRPVADLHQVLAGADHVIMLLPSDTGTDNFMGVHEFECMSQHAVIYNFGRGNSIDEVALAEALKEGSIGGACLDVFDQEPLSAESPLADETLPGLVRMPHSSAFCESYIDRFMDEIIEWLR